MLSISHELSSQDPKEVGTVLIPILQMREYCLEMLSDLPKVTQLESDGARLKLSFVGF